MNTKQITETLCVCGQISEADVARIAGQGFKSIIINRPNGEGRGQPSHDRIEAAAQELGLRVCYIPVTPGQMSMDHIAAFGGALEELPGPVLAYCKTGMRAVSLWAMSHAGKIETTDILSTAQQAGYDLSKLAGPLQALARR